MALIACWAPLGRALGDLHWRVWGLVLPVAVAAVVAGTGAVAILRDRERSVLLVTLFVVTTAIFLIAGALLLGLALGRPDLKTGG